MSNAPEYYFRDENAPIPFEALEVRRRVLKAIENEPDGFEMTHWILIRPDDGTQNICKTAMCIAGHAVLIAGMREIPADLFLMSADDACAWLSSFEHNINRDAMLALGLSHREYYLHSANGMFYARNDKAVVVEWLREITEGAGEPLR